MTDKKEISMVIYWRYIFTPLLLLTIVFGLYVLFTISPTHNMSFDRVIKQFNTIGPIHSVH